MYVGNQIFLILGASKSGCSAARFVLAEGGKCFVYEELTNEKISASIEELKSLGAIIVDKEEIDEIIPRIDVLIISPGVPINHEIAVKAKQRGKRISGELEFGFLQFFPPTVAVTGTNGKTTTVSMIASIFKTAGKGYKTVGNIGVPVTGEVCSTNRSDVCIAEVSSFQLESISFFCPHIACVLNISPDHLERHYTMDNYIFLKKRIFACQRESEYTILNKDDVVVSSFAKETRAKTIFVSVKEKTDGGYLEDDKLYYKGEYVIDVADMPVSGEHNVFNALFAICVCKLMGIDTETVRQGLKDFKGVKHRVELIAEKNGVRYYDDSKATNTASAITAINTVKSPVVLILGGSEKGENYKALFNEIKKGNVKHTVITGAARYNMTKTATDVGVDEITVTPRFDLAVRIAADIAEEGDSVLLSPACASYDFFSSYEERGEKFVSIVKGLHDA